VHIHVAPNTFICISYSVCKILAFYEVVHVRHPLVEMP